MSIYDVIEDRIYNWGCKNDEVLAIYIVGSRARENKPFDEYSDLDVVVFSTNPDYYLQDSKWLPEIGTVWIDFTFQTVHGDPEKLVLFEQGAQVDFLFQHISCLEHSMNSGQIPLGFQRGVKILLDKTENGQRLVPQTKVAPENMPITAENYLQTNKMYCFACLYVGKQILRDEFWVANQRDKDCKQMLLQMIEWHAKALNGETHDTWHAGRFIREWAEKSAIEELKDSFIGFDQESNWKALISSIELFSRLSYQVASTYHYAFPAELFSKIQMWLNEHQLIKD
ncbi:aminoglycoside 6-adenylyltransferase [Paenibacillus sp. Marseille-Q4541]|uniref:aminoglycoside 6-adenylyltransferase n=1 Tax=Paenibacillus sp. Marseille-Q4541 TaxID=2831522 RepID=UPI001BAA86B0|nr:aminoglycoside 6-adenylyltransferase [Paenibacillus sp. Marseille-Q4541]